MVYSGYQRLIDGRIHVMDNATAYRYDANRIINFLDYPVIVCYLCTFEPRYGAGEGRDLCGCTGLVTLLERAGILGKLTW